ncbi:MAG: type II toxin-antitoxin system HicA family toxin [Dethiobacter sp.]|nr:type II toxin-antitoxin system HicA family toxin [Dethiobacter sp.]MCL5982079.1 type II toxin-antitoxin system HicA family toxin [Bacillota bacterium]
MTKIPILSSKDIVRVLLKNGFEFAPKRGKGSHIAFVKKDDNKTRLVIVPDRKEIPKGTLLSILEQAGLSKDDLLRLLEG